MYNVRMKFFRENIIKYGTLVTVFLLPVIPLIKSYYFPFISPKTFFFYGAVEIVFVLWLFTILVDKSYRLSKKQFLFFIPLSLYIAWLTITGFFAVNPTLSFWSTLERGTGLLTLYHALAFTLVVASLVKRDGLPYLYTLFKWIISGAFILALSVWTGNEGFNLAYNAIKNSQGGGLMGNSSLAAPYLLFSLFFGIFLLLQKSISSWWKVFISVTVITILFSPLFINIRGLTAINGSLLGTARGVVLGLFVGIAVSIFGYLILSKNKIKKIVGITSILILLVIFSVGWVELVKPDTYLHNKFTQSASGSRFIFWEVAQKSISQHPFFGYGPENYMIAFQENFNPKILNMEYGHESWNDKAHNIYYDTGVSGGYPAILFYAIFLASIFYFIYRAFVFGKISHLQASILWGLLVGYIFQNLFVFDSLLSILALFMITGLFIGLSDDKSENKIIDSKKIDVVSKKREDTLKILTAITLIIFFSFSFFYFVISPSKKSKLLNTVLETSIGKRPEAYPKLLGGSSVGNDWDVGGFADSIYKIYTTNLLEIKKNKELLPYLNNDLKSLVGYLEIVSKSNTTDFRLNIIIVRLYNIYLYLNDLKYDSVSSSHMLEILNHAHQLSPTSPEFYWWMSQIYLDQGDINGAKESYQKALLINPSVKASNDLFINFAENIGDQKLYDQSLKEAQINIPGYKQ